VQKADNFNKTFSNNNTLKLLRDFTQLLVGVYFILFSIQAGQAQDQKVKWKRSAVAELDLQLFHSTEVLHLPTAETLQRGDFQFEISHRFTTPISSGYGELWGFDGSVIMRIGLGYALTDRMMLNLARSNLEGNIDLTYRYKAVQIRNDILPTLLTFQVGAAYNGKAVNQVDHESDKFQYFGSLIANTLYKKKFGLGLVASYLNNSHIYCLDNQYSFTLGGYLQHYLGDTWSLVSEFNSTVSGWRNKHNAFALGIELETGGHFFKFVIGNSTSLNLAQYLAGAQDSFTSADWHFGFNITRLFRFK
jgi:hypothetical protein